MPEALASAPSMGHKIKLPVNCDAKTERTAIQTAEASNLKGEETASTHLIWLTHWPKEETETADAAEAPRLGSLSRPESEQGQAPGNPLLWQLSAITGKTPKLQAEAREFYMEL